MKFFVKKIFIVIDNKIVRVDFEEKMLKLIWVN